MMISGFLSYLRKLDVKVWADGDRLRYDAPEGVMTPNLRAELAERKAEILAFLSETAAMALSSTALTIKPVSRSEDAPLSFAQKRLWFLDQLEPNNPLYNIAATVRLTGHLDVGALRRSLNDIVQRHQTLRTSFKVVEGQPVQVIAPALQVPLPVKDLAGLPGPEREAEALRRAREERRRPFDLGQGPLLRAELLRLGEEEHVLLVSTHHIVSDGWSMDVFWRELAALYGAFSEGESSPLPELPIQYVDFAAWQREWLQGEVLEGQLSYWRRQLEGAPTVLELPTDRPRPPIQTFCGARRSLSLPGTLAKALKELGRREGATLFMVLLAAFQALLSRYSGQEDFMVGSPIANRNRAETEGLIGFFVNTLVLRGDLSGDPTFRELLGRARGAALGAYAHQDLPFEKLVEELEPERDPSRTPLVQVVFALQNAPLWGGVELPDLALERLEVDGGTAKFDLTLLVSESPEGGLEATFEYNTDLFDEATIDRMLRHLRVLLEGLAADPERRVSELPLLTDAERRQILIEWNDTEAEYPKDKCIHELFEEQVERSPEAVAVVFEEQQLTYGELNARANQLAHHLRNLGVGPEVLVGICVERSLEMVVGLLGILKAGGAYVPLDPSYPEERLSFMLEDAQVSVLVTQERLVGMLPEHAAQVVQLDAGSETLAQESEQNPDGEVTAENLAYVIYTSGSTGKPKGVLVEHRGLCNVAEAQVRAFGTRAYSRVLQFASLSFDASIFEIVMALYRGATLCLGTQDSLLPGPALARLLRDQAISIVTLPPSALMALSDTQFPALETITVAGEVCPASLVARWSEGRRFFNLYGPTEATIWATATECTDGNQKPPIGRPIANTRVYILDRHVQPVPVGVPGELHVGGDGLARSYLNRPELTAEKFIPDPFSDQPDARLYKTGDLARYRPNGDIEFLGRVDHQVKIRGFRVEPGEIESILNGHATVHESVVVPYGETQEHKRLVAYVVPTGPSAPSPKELRALLRDELPGHMVPSAFVALDALPLTPNGKVDRRALPAPEGLHPELENAFVAPRDELEERLAEIWTEVLGVARVGIHDDFFELGGHSLLATRVVSRLRDAFQVELPLRSLFEEPTVAELAMQIAQYQAEKVDSEEMALLLAEIEELSLDEER